MNKFRVWCKTYNEWEKDFCFLGQNGELFENNRVHGVMILDSKKHILQFSAEKNDDNGKELFEGDIVKIIYDGTLERKEYIGIIECDDIVDGYYIAVLDKGSSVHLNDENIMSIIKIGNEFENPE